MKFLERNVPDVDLSEFVTAVATHWRLAGGFRPLESERDFTYRLDGPEGTFVVRVANSEESPDVVDFQVQAQDWLEAADTGVRYPKAVPALDGSPFKEVRFGHRQRHIVRVTEWIDGDPAWTTYPGKEYFRAAGAVIARMDRALTGFFHPAANHDHPWVIMQALRYRDLTHHISDPKARDLVEWALDQFEETVLPLDRSLPHQVIHQDAHPGNVILDERGGMRGIIDFGDMLFGPRVAGLAAAADVWPGMTITHFDALLALAVGYDSVTELTDDEATVLPALHQARLAISITLKHARSALNPAEEPYVSDGPLQVRALRAYHKLGVGAVQDRLRSALRMPAWVGAETPDQHQALLDTRRATMGRSPTFYREPLHFERGEGTHLIAKDGRRYLDFYNNVPQVGHNHPHVTKAIARQVRALNTNTRYLYANVVEYADRLTSLLPDHLSAVVFVNSGSEANDVAWQFAKAATGNTGGLVMEDAYHGITDAIRSFSPSSTRATRADHVGYLLPPDPYRGPHREGDLAALYAADADRAIAELAAHGHAPAAFMVDTALCSNGVVSPPSGYFPAVADKVRAAGGLVIADEVQAGFGRLGSMWGHVHHGMKADIVTMGKPVGNGFPLGVVVTTPEILSANAGLFSTFGGNPVAAAAGLAVLDVIEREGLVQHGRLVGNHLRAAILHLSDTHPLIGDVRGSGALTGVEFVRDRALRTPATGEAGALVERLKDLGVLVGVDGPDGNVLKLRPPLILDSFDVAAFAEALDTALHALETES